MKVHKDKLKTYPLPSPPTKEEQEAISKVLDDMGAELAALEQRRDKPRLLKQGMMKELLTGHIRLVAPIASPAAQAIRAKSRISQASTR